MVGTDDEGDVVRDAFFVGYLCREKSERCLAARRAEPRFEQAAAVLLPVVARLAQVEHDGFPLAEKFVDQGQDGLPQLGVAGGLAVTRIGEYKFIGFNLGQKIAGRETYGVIYAEVCDEVVEQRPSSSGQGVRADSVDALYVKCCYHTSNEVTSSPVRSLIRARISC